MILLFSAKSNIIERNVYLMPSGKLFVTPGEKRLNLAGLQLLRFVFNRKNIWSTNDPEAMKALCEIASSVLGIYAPENVSSVNVFIKEGKWYIRFGFFGYVCKNDKAVYSCRIKATDLYVVFSKIPALHDSVYATWPKEHKVNVCTIKMLLLCVLTLRSPYFIHTVTFFKLLGMRSKTDAIKLSGIEIYGNGFKRYLQQAMKLTCHTLFQHTLLPPDQYDLQKATDEVCKRLRYKCVSRPELEPLTETLCKFITAEVELLSNAACLEAGYFLSDSLRGSLPFK